MDSYLENVRVIKKDGTKEKYKPEKIITAVCKSASRALVEFTPEEKTRITDYVNETIIKMGLIEIPIVTMHALVEHALDEVNPDVYKRQVGSSLKRQRRFWKSLRGTRYFISSM